jgi:hypothetical protein
MARYRIPVEWVMVATVEVEAESLDEAIEKVEAGSLPENGEYLSDSFAVQDFVHESDIE